MYLKRYHFFNSNSNNTLCHDNIVDDEVGNMSTIQKVEIIFVQKRVIQTNRDRLCKEIFKKNWKGGDSEDNEEIAEKPIKDLQEI